MGIKKIDTRFAPVERASSEELIRQSNLFKNKKDLISMAEAMAKMVLILNQERQIVYANSLFLDIIGIANIDLVIGQRTGEAIHCIHANQTEAGCGTTEFCRKCGALSAILEAQNGKLSTRECRISTRDNESLDLEVNTTPLLIENESFIIFAISDISDKKRKELLERVFFHDVLNSAGSISGLSKIMQEITDPVELAEISKLINSATENLMEEIHSQRQLNAAERGDLSLNIIACNSLDILSQIAELYSKHDTAADKKIFIEASSESRIIETDQTLLRRILGNMARNAIEASLPGSTITLSCFHVENKMTFSVNNASYMPYGIQLQLFKRSFSTKGVGRGIGTYSMKLFGEKYLKGKVWFESQKTSGTTFYLELP